MAIDLPYKRSIRSLQYSGNTFRLVFVLIVIGVFIRVAALGTIPSPIMQDELSDIYDGYSIAETGADRSGIEFPLVVRGFGEGDYRPALYPWLAAAPAKLVGFSVAAGRLPSALLGSAAIILLYFFARNVGGDAYGLATLAFAAFSPWLVFFSRVGHQGSMLPAFFVALILFLWERASSHRFRPSLVASLGLAVGLSANAYPSTRITAILLAACIALFVARRSENRVRDLLVFSVAAFAGALPQLLVLVRTPEHFFARSHDTLIRPHSLADLVVMLAHNIELNLRPRYLFAPNMVETYLTPARLLPIEALLFYPGFLLVRRQKGRIAEFRPYLYAAVLIAILPAALNNPNPHSVRASSLAMLTPLFSASTVIAIRDSLSSRRQMARAFDYATGLALLSSASLIAFLYFNSKTARSFRMQNDVVQAATLLGKYQRSYQRVFFDNAGLQPYLYVVAFTGMTPNEYMNALKDMGSSPRGFDEVKRIGKYYFADSSVLEQRALESATGRELFVSRHVLPGLTLVDSVRASSTAYYFLSRGQATPR
jgi:4-amino-4-deoxy-L-arabinose transferase-like glycosyltransferase